MSHASVKFLGPIRRPWPERQRQVELEEGDTVSTLLTRLGLSPAEQEHLFVAINAQSASLSVVLKPDDALEVMLRTGGG